MLKDYLPDYGEERIRLCELAPAGWVLAFNFSVQEGVEIIDSTMPQAWQDAYGTRGGFIEDPVLRWIVTSPAGVARWSEIVGGDNSGIMAAARAHGLRYGMAITKLVNTYRSFISLSRSDREFTDEEMKQVGERFLYWVDLLHNRASLTEGELAVLECLRDGHQQRQTAERLSVSLDTVKYRSQRVQEKLRAKTAIQAVAIAKARGFI